ncbi:YadA C-terminal domain-containing protein [Edwardsiella tarda]|uniref:YadA C-terminal domain-containing protein n=1 Tax=Edwardsiella tarda TaxID=636 RepID=UPI000D519C89|nr:YadA C-terminal domain-containing protein [Edwardsiella tarda]UCQ54974.1 YadA C-terminal domain-containing protein [Edwardsiella tarda]
MKRHTLAALISSLFVLSSAYGYADDTIPDATATLPVPSPEVPVAPPAAPATLNAAELAAVAKGLPQIAPHIQTQAEQSVKTSLAAAEYFQTQVQNIIKASGEAEKLRNITNKAVNNPLIRKIILEPMAKYKVQVDGVKAVENYASYMSSVYRSSADMAAIAALKAASEANQQSFLFNAALHDALTSNQARTHQVYDTLHAYTSTHVVDYNLGKLAQRVLIDQPKIDTLMKNLLPAVFQPAYQENMVGLLASLQQANTSVERIQQAQQFATMLTDNKVADKLNGAALLAAVQESYQGVQSNQRALTQLQQARQAALNDSKRELSAAIQANSHSLSRRIDENRKKAAAGIAGVAAMSNIPIPYAEGSFTVGVGVGYYDSQSAGAIGIGKGFENGLAIKASASFATDSNVAIGGGASWSF